MPTLNVVSFDLSVNGIAINLWLTIIVPTETPRKQFHAHNNAVIDVKWSKDDEHLVILNAIVHFYFEQLLTWILITADGIWR